MELAVQRRQCDMAMSRGRRTVSRDIVARMRRVRNLLLDKIEWVKVTCRQSWSEWMGAC